MSARNKSFFEKQIAVISKSAFDDETKVVKSCLPLVKELEKQDRAIKRRSNQLIRNIRLDNSNSGIEGFIHQFGLNNHEGIVIMCLAEALLRIPDNHTANRLIHDKLKDANWEQHINDVSNRLMMFQNNVAQLIHERPESSPSDSVGLETT